MNELIRRVGADAVDAHDDALPAERARVDALARRARAKPILLPSRATPFTGGEAAQWWRDVAAVGDIVIQAVLQRAGRPPGGAGKAAGACGRRCDRWRAGCSRSTSRRRSSASCSRSRRGLEPAAGRGSSPPRPGSRSPSCRRSPPAGGPRAWIAHIWSWGWGVFNEAGSDPDKQGARRASGSEGARPAPLQRAGMSPSSDADRRGRVRSIFLAASAARSATLRSRPTRSVSLTRLTRDPRGLAVGALRPPRRERRGVRRPARHFRGRADDRRAPLPRQHGRVSRGPAAGACDPCRGTRILGDELRRRSDPGETDSSLAVHCGARRAAADVRHRPGPRGSGRPGAVVVKPDGRGVALGLDAPEQIFFSPLGRAVKVRTFEGVFTVRALADTSPLAAIPVEGGAPGDQARYGRPHRPIATTAGRRRAEARPRRPALHPRPVAAGRRRRAHELPAVSDADGGCLGGSGTGRIGVDRLGAHPGRRSRRHRPGRRRRARFPLGPLRAVEVLVRPLEERDGVVVAAQLDACGEVQPPGLSQSAGSRRRSSKPLEELVAS